MFIFVAVYPFSQEFRNRLEPSWFCTGDILMSTLRQKKFSSQDYIITKIATAKRARNDAISTGEEPSEL